jgi:hypothetical protein
MEPEIPAHRRERLGGVPRAGQIQRDQRANAGRRSVPVEVDAMQMDEVDRPALERPRDGGAVMPPAGLACLRIERAVDPRYRQQRSGDVGTSGGDHERSMPGIDQAAIDLPDDLLGAADRTRTDRRKRIGDVEDGEAHRGPCSASSASAAAAHFCHTVPVMPQGKRS